MALLRAVRVRVDQVPVKFDGGFGRLVDISASGALLRLDRPLAIDKECPLTISASPEPVRLTARVVRSVPPLTPSERAGQAPAHHIGVRFVEMSAAAKLAVASLCGQYYDMVEE